MKRRNRRITTIFSIIALAMTMLVVGASADAGANAECEFDGQATLNSGFPATNGEGTFSGTANCTGSIVTVGADMDATFTYEEPASTCPLQGTASGSFTISGTDVVTGNSVTVTGDFDWRRDGATAAIEISSVNGGPFTNASGAATAAFESPDAVNCDGSVITATVVGAAAIADTN